MEAFNIDHLDRQIIHALIIDGRVPFSRVAAVTGASEQTVARRYRRMHAAAVVRVVAVPDTHRIGESKWVVRLQCVPDAASAVADALARRPDTSWVQLTSGGTEICCMVQPLDGSSGHDLLLRQLPASRRIVAVSAHSLLHMFRGGASHWPGATMALTQEQAAALTPPPLGHGRRRIGHALQPDHPLGLAGPLRIGHADHADHGGGVHPPVTPGHGLLGGAGHRGDAAEGSPAVDDQGMDDLAVQMVDIKCFHRP